MTREPLLNKQSNTDIDLLRAGIDEIDLKIIKLLGERFRLTFEIGSIKRTNGSAVYDGLREAYLQNRYSTLAKLHNVDESLCAKIFNEIMIQSRKQQKELKEKA